MNAQSDPEHDGKSHGGGLLAALAFGLIMYVALLGPIARVADSLPKPLLDALEHLYFPLQWLDDHIPGDLISKYVDLWLN